MRVKKLLLLVLMTVLLMSPTTRMALAAEQVTSLEQLNRPGATVGVGTGDVAERAVVEDQGTMPALDMPEHPSEHLVVATSGIVPPYSYYEGDRLMGYDIELAYRLAVRLDADVEFVVPW